jgi:CubicO group peptidase (beta-lactamase class C family)
MEMTRRHFTGLAAAFTTGVARAATTNTTSVRTALSASVKRNGIPAIAACVGSAHGTLYRGAFGTRDSKSRVPVTTQSIFRIASMTKAITAVATMQLVERGKLKLDEPVGRYLPELTNLQVLDGFKDDGEPILRPAASPVLLKQLLTHTSGFAYDLWDAQQMRYTQYLEKKKTPESRVTPLSFDPGTEWRYGTSMDWAGRIVEGVGGQTLEAFFQQNILQPLSMRDTSFILPPAKFPRLVGLYRRDESGKLKEQARKQPPVPKSFNGGGGLFSTPEDYVKFMQMILRRGTSPLGKQILRAETVDLMIANHAGEISAGKLKTTRPAGSADMDMHPGHTDGFAYGFLINNEAYDGGRAEGSLAWAGIDNTFFWIDPKRQLCATIMMQFLPFCDPAAMGVLRDFEHAIYATFKS